MSRDSGVGKPPFASRMASMDLLRVLAMAAVAVQHGLTVIGHYEWTKVTASGMTIGQFGVSVFCASAGWFAFADKRPPLTWFVARCLKVFPAYWLVTLLAFAIAIAMGRPVTIGLFVSQMLGTGFFTHGWDLVNVVSWFLSLILLCYAIAAVAKLLDAPITICLLTAAATIILVVLEVEVSLSRHVLTFVIGAIGGLYRRPIYLFIGGVVIAPLIYVQPNFIYAAVTLVIMWRFIGYIHLEWRAPAHVASYLYEFFLIHGIVLQAAALILPWPFAALVLGIIISFAAAIILKRTVEVMAASLLRGQLLQ